MRHFGYYSSQINKIYTIFMIQHAIERLAFLCDTIPALLRQISPADFAYKPHPDKWSKKEIIGHLIDSATNNHQRFVRGQFEDTPKILYQQNHWNTYSYHQNIDAEQIISFWALYNKQLLEIIKCMPDEMLLRTVETNAVHTIAFLFEDYVAHAEHHLKQVVVY